ncbi:MAG: hypothetical protein MZU97_13615 [Bacillus subtilis]|nr:hypothetical protein [Bacillus subtilis]
MRNFIVLAGPANDPDLAEKCGYYGEADRPRTDEARPRHLLGRRVVRQAIRVGTPRRPRRDRPRRRHRLRTRRARDSRRANGSVRVSTHLRQKRVRPVPSKRTGANPPGSSRRSRASRWRRLPRSTAGRSIFNVGTGRPHRAPPDPRRRTPRSISALRNSIFPPLVPTGSGSGANAASSSSADKQKRPSDGKPL